MKTLKKCEKYLITVKCNDPFITSSYIQKTEGGEVVDLFNNLYFWFDDAYGQECFIACNADNVISIEDMPTKLPAIIQS